MTKQNQTNDKPLEKLVGGYSYTSIFRKIAFIGDSLSSGEFETVNAEGNKEYHDFYEYSWGQYIARRNGLTAYNFSQGGMKTKSYEDFADKHGYWDKDKACQAYVIALGVNDLWTKSLELGSVNDVDVDDYHNNAKTYAGYYAQIISRYKEISPDAKFFLVGLPRSDDDWLNNIAKNMTALLEDFAEKFDNTYVINLYKYGETHDSEFKKVYYLHSHMTPAGYIYMAETIDSYIDYIIRHNPEEFKYAGLINSDVKYES